MIAVIFYSSMAALALAGASWADINLLEWHDAFSTPMSFDAVLGLLVGLAVVIATALLERFAEWARRLGAAFSSLLGPMSFAQITVFAVTSSIGEELLFRGFLQQWLSDVVLQGPMSDWWGLIGASLIFGLVHVGPDRRTFLPWTIMAVVMGFALGGMYLYTGSVLAPVLCHFTINLLNLRQIALRARAESE